MNKVSDVYHNKKLNTTIIKLYNKSLWYTKIHKYLIENEYKIGKSSTYIDSIIMKIIMRKEFLN